MSFPKCVRQLYPWSFRPLLFVDPLAEDLMVGLNEISDENKVKITEQVKIWDVLVREERRLLREAAAAAVAAAIAMAETAKTENEPSVERLRLDANEPDNE